MKTITAAGLALLLGGCAVAGPVGSRAGVQTYTGEVWTWDERDSVVTLMQDGGQLVRVRVSPQQLDALTLHQRVRLAGIPAGPAEIPSTLVPARAVTAVPKGQAEIVEVRGTVTSVDPSGRVAVNTDRGPLHLWAATGADQRFPVGAPVLVWMSVQPVDLVPAPAPTAAAPEPVNGAAASPSSEPGDHSVVTGRVIGVNPGGVLVVESPTGPIQILATDVGHYAVGQPVQVRSTIRTAS